jgi:hypothetical protein
LRIQERYRLIFRKPLGYVLTWIVIFGLMMLAGRIFSPIVNSIENKQTLDFVQIISGVFSVFIAISIIAGGFRVSNLSEYSRKSLFISGLVAAFIYIFSAFLVRIEPLSAWLILLNGLGLVILSFVVGEFLSREVIHSGHLIPTVLVLALVDTWSVTRGLSGNIAHKVTEFASKGGYSGTIAPPWSSFLLLRYPQFASKDIYSFIGIGDLIIIAFFTGCVFRFKLPVFLSFFSLIGGTVMAVLIANIIGKPIPALPVIATLFLIVNIKHLSMKKNDIIISAITLAIIVIVILFLSLKH